MTSLRARLSVFLILAAVLTALVIGAITYRHTLKENEDLLDYQLRQIALSLRDQGVVADPSYYQKDEALDVVIQIWTSNGAMLYLSVPGAPLLDRATLGFTDVFTSGRQWRVFSLAARERIIQVAQPLELRTDLAAAAALRSLTPLLAFVPLMALLIWWVVGTSLASLERLADQVGRRDAHSLEALGDQGLPGEITPLVASINSLLVRLKRAFSSQRAFVADAAHELRSPLTALKLQLQLLDHATDPAARTAALEKLNQGVDRATHLIEQLLTAAQTDPDDTDITLQPTDVAELARQSIAELFALVQARHQSISMEAPLPLMIQADAPRLRILLRNLLDNAIRYTPQHGQIQASVRQHDEYVQLIVEDSGAGIAEEERARVFQRFIRGEGNTQSGSGLGLSIVKNIAEQHHAEITLERSALGGLRVVVSFARMSPPPLA
jgi:signal transduction histidine kinase